MAGFLERHDNIFLYIPNLIGYARVALAMAAFHAAFSRPGACVALYFLSFACDELDGRAARAFDQASTFGALLDMVTDRAATAGLLALLVALHPWCATLWLGLLALDVASHWLQMYASLAAGAATHKDVASRSALVRAYYTHRLFMGFCCVCCEVMYLALYLLAWPEWQAAGAVKLPPALVAKVPASWAAALPPLAALKRTGGLPGAAVVALLAAPGVAVKQACNWLQLKTAAASLVEYDLKKRRRRTAAAPAGMAAAVAASATPVSPRRSARAAKRTSS